MYEDMIPSILLWEKQDFWLTEFEEREVFFVYLTYFPFPYINNSIKMQLSLQEQKVCYA